MARNIISSKPGPAAAAPAAPPQAPVLWTLFSWIRREIGNTFFNTAPKIAYQQAETSQTFGGVITGDEVTIDWDLECPCGRTTVALEHEIMRYSEKRDGAEDKISCAATHEVQNEAIDFLKELA